MNENFSKGIKTILKHARNEAKRLKSSFVSPEHLLLGIIKDKDGQANKMLRSLGCDINEMNLIKIALINTLYACCIRVRRMLFIANHDKRAGSG